MAKVLGVITIEANGMLIDSNKGAKIDLGGTKRTSKMTARRRAGSQSEQMPGRVEGSFPMTTGISLSELQALEDITVKVRLDTGQLYSMAHSDWMDPPNTDDQSGDVPFAFEGDAMQEISGG